MEVREEEIVTALRFIQAGRREEDEAKDTEIMKSDADFLRWDVNLSVFFEISISIHTTYIHISRGIKSRFSS